MLRREIIETESGKLLVWADDGFVLYGSLYKGDGRGGLIGSGKVCDVGFAYTNEEFLDTACNFNEDQKAFYEAAIEEY